MITGHIKFPKATGIQCSMMPFIQGDSSSVPEVIRKMYGKVLDENFMVKGEIGYLTIDESTVEAGSAQRAYRAKFDRALHTEVGITPDKLYCWGGVPTWGGNRGVTLRHDTRILLANNMDDTCAVWDATHNNTSLDGDIGDSSELYPYKDAVLMKAGDVHEIGILTPHESLPVNVSCNRQFMRIVSKGVKGRASHFTKNPLLEVDT